MKFLNLDLDFFISGLVHTPQSLKRRVSKKRHKPWSAEQLGEFLETQCGLDRSAKIPGRFGVHHDSVFDYWRSLIRMMSPGTQLDLVHIDAHGDFSGFIDPGVHVFLMKQLLSYSAAHRPYIIDKNRSHMTLANYMSFAVACRWIFRIEFVTHPNWKQDIYDVFFRGKNPASGLIEFCTPTGQAEPSVPITFTPQAQFSQAGFSHAFLSQSPNYTPITADQLLPIFENYIDFSVT